jgi:hypothetical protein
MNAIISIGNFDLSTLIVSDKSVSHVTGFVAFMADHLGSEAFQSLSDFKSGGVQCRREPARRPLPSSFGPHPTIIWSERNGDK